MWEMLSIVKAVFDAMTRVANTGVSCDVTDIFDAIGPRRSPMATRAAIVRMCNDSVVGASFAPLRENVAIILMRNVTDNGDGTVSGNVCSYGEDATHIYLMRP